MNQLPRGWRTVQLSEVALSIGNGIFARRPNDAGNGVRILRISAVRNGAVDLSDCRHVEGVTREQLAKYTVSAGDLLLTRYNGSRHLVGASGIVQPHSETVLHPDKLIRVVIDPEAADPRFANYQLQSSAVRAFLEPRIRTTAGQSGISGRDVRAVPLALPSLDVQRRIVDILEDHLSRLDAADSYLLAATVRADRLEGAGVLATVLGAADASSLARMVAAGDRPPLPAGWAWHELGDVAEVVGGVTKDAKKQSGPGLVEVPYLRVANVQRTRLDLENVISIRVPEAKARALELRPGDVLMNEGGDRDKLARGWVWRGEVPRCIHQNHVYRARPMQNQIEPEWLAWCANTLGGEWAQRHGRQSVNLASISLSTIRRMPIPVPPLDEQRAGLERITALRGVGSSARDAAAAARLRGATLRRALLAAAFSGRLTGRSQDLELAEELIDA